ncbi:uncharacterized protein LOC131289076 [Anopheles ziemanni]|uniref:uncharacterized protein LOC131260069 n=1 Tax=Anopheles coustani TaxID=139045 RepID=UPI0026587ED0|nr:uncharacterized protein LOC131260069 [Anopheles coustani]XP_058174258.1 uncharacterized protein LOC131289076 [Anopheles ziemanni]
MKLIILSLCILLTNIYATQALRCMQGGKFTDGSISLVWGRHEITECNMASTAISAINLLLIKPSTVSFPSDEYKCYHLRYEDVNKIAGIFKGCIYKNQDVCDGVYKGDTFTEVFCSQCNEDECNSSIRFASDWKILSLTMFAILTYLMQ